MKLNNIYTTFNGEVNIKGIGSPCIFVRLQGCPIRCYAKTMGILCDTPEGLKKSKTKDSVDWIVAELEKEREKTGLSYVTLTGGDPLWNDERDLHEFFQLTYDLGYTISIETSGTISWLPYIEYTHLNWVIDYKGNSTGIDSSINLLLNKDHLKALKSTDFIKFIIANDVDDYYSDLVSFIKLHEETECKAIIAVGTFWGEYTISTFSLFDLLKHDRLLHKVTINMQTHKLALSPNYSTTIPTDI